MSYRISEEKVVSYDRNDVSVEAVIIASSTAALPAYNEVPGRILLPGSAAIIPSEGAIYILDTDSEWKWGAAEDE